MSGLARTDTGRAAGLGVAVIAANVIALVFTVVFARVLGATDYGSLAALMSAFIILMVPGSALQIAVAREVSASLAAGDGLAGAGVRRWVGRLAARRRWSSPSSRYRCAACSRPILNVDQEWAAAAVPVTAMLWMVLSVERGALQGFQRYKLVAWSIIGEAGSRLAFALLLVAVGLDVTGAFLGTALSFVAVGLVLAAPLAPHLPEVDGRAAARPARRRLGAGARAHAPVRAPGGARDRGQARGRRRHRGRLRGGRGGGEGDRLGGRGPWHLPAARDGAALARGRGRAADPARARSRSSAAAAVPMVLIYTLAGEPLLRAVFGDDLTEASGALPWLGLAMALLACAYLSVQYLLALHHRRFIAVLAVAAVAEVVLLLAIGANLTRIALALAALQLVCAACMVTQALRTAPVR